MSKENQKYSMNRAGIMNISMDPLDLEPISLEGCRYEEKAIHQLGHFSNSTDNEPCWRANQVQYSMPDIKDRAATKVPGDYHSIPNNGRKDCNNPIHVNIPPIPPIPRSFITTPLIDEICSSLTDEKTKRVLERASKRKRSKYNNSVPPPARISSSFTSTHASKEHNEFLFDRNLYPPRNLSNRGCNSTRKFDSPGNAYADTISIPPMTNKSTQHYAEPERFLQLQQSNRYPHAPTTASWNNQSQEEVSLFSNILSLFETDQDQTLAPIHKACAHFADNNQFISMMLRRNSNCASLRVDLSEQPLSKSKEMVVPICPSHNSQSETDYFVKDGQYPIHIAVSNNASVEVVRSLIYAFPAALSKPDCNGMLPLSLAIRFFRSAVDKVNMQATLEFLLQCYPEAANSVDNRRNTALHYICMISSQRSAQRKWMLGGEKKNNLSISMEFMKRLAMANPNAIHRRNFDFLTPLELAQTTGNNYINDEMSNFLLDLACVEDDVECHDTL